MTIAQVLLASDDQSASATAGVAEAFPARGVEQPTPELVVHGSTVVRSRIFEENQAEGVPRTAEGHEEIHDLARGRTLGPPSGWMGMHRPNPVVHLGRSHPIAGGMNGSGERIAALDGGAPCRSDAGEKVVEPLTHALQHADVNPDPGRQAQEFVPELDPGLLVSISSDLPSEYPEHERTLTIVPGAYARPQVLTNVDHLECELRDRWFAAPFSIVRSA